VKDETVFTKNFYNFKAIPKKIILMFVQNKLVLKNLSDSDGYVCISVENFYFAFGENVK
jgi:hypothetical protein